MANIRERVTSTGERKYRVEIRLRGYPRQSATFKRKTDALHWATQTEAAILEGRHFKASESKKRTFGELVDHYMATVVPVRHTSEQARQTIELHLAWWKKHLGPYLLADISPAKIAQLRDKLLASPARGAGGRPLLNQDGSPRRRKSPATVVRYLASLSVVFATATNEWEWIDQNPVQKVRRPRESRGRVRFLSDNERERLIAACKASSNPYLFTVVIIALSTGARYGEIIGLRWRDIDLIRGIARLERTKNRERRALPLTHVALEAVKRLHKKVKPKPGDFLFARADGLAPMEIRKHWYKAMEDAELEDFRFHDLRHSAASYLAMNGATLAEIAEILGHKTLQMVKRYAHLSDQHTAKVVERMNKSIFKD